MVDSGEDPREHIFFIAVGKRWPLRVEAGGAKLRVAFRFVKGSKNDDSSEQWPSQWVGVSLGDPKVQPKEPAPTRARGAQILKML